MMDYMAAPKDGNLMGETVKPVVEEINPQEEKYNREVIVRNFAFERRGIKYEDVNTKGQKLHKNAGDLRADTAAEIGNGIIEPVIGKTPDTSNKQLDSYEQKKYRYRINNETHDLLNYKI
jgi:hypothetical protein